LKDFLSFGMTASVDITLISTVPELEAFLSSITPSSTLFLGVEGHCLGRHITISLIIIHLPKESNAAHRHLGRRRSAATVTFRKRAYFEGLV
jgi:hypothetical protein